MPRKHNNIEMNSRLAWQLKIAFLILLYFLPRNQNFTLFLQAGRYATKGERALRATVCFSVERARPSDAADVYIKTSNDI